MGNPLEDDDQTEPDPAKIESRLKCAISICKRNHTRTANSCIKSLQSPTLAVKENSLFLQQEYEKTHYYLQKLDDAHLDYLTFIQEDDKGETDTNASLQEDVERNYWTTIGKWNVPGKETNKSKTEVPPISTPRLKIPDLPPFENTIRAYPKFKMDFRNHYESFYGFHAPLVLKNNLLKDFSKEVCSGSQTVDEIFQQLDTIYGDTGKLVERIMSDIQKIKTVTDGNLGELRSLRNVIYLAEVDLRGVNLEKHIDQYQTVILVVGKLPPAIQRRWAEKVARDNVATDRRYEELMKFLELEIRTLDLIPQTLQEKKWSTPQQAILQTPPTLAPTPRAVRSSQASATIARTEPNQNQNRIRGEPKCPLHPTMSGHFFSQCHILKKSSVEEKISVMRNEAKNFCRACLRPSHQGTKCEVEILPCRREGCTRKHFTHMHEACEKLRPPGANQHSYRLETEIKDVIHSISPAQYVETQTSTGNEKLVLIWDQGSNITLTTNEVCQKYNFEIIDEKPTILTMETVGSEKKTQEATRCKIPLLNYELEPVTTVIAYTVESIGNIENIDLSAAFDLFAISIEERKCMSFPRGKIDLLIGTDNSHLILAPMKEINGLRLDESSLGRIIYGRHPSFKPTRENAFKTQVVSKTRISTPPTRTIKLRDVAMETEVKSLFSTDTMGISCSPRCGRCGCGKCTLISGWSLQEKYEYEQIRSSMSLENGVITASYPYRKDTSNLPDNEPYAIKRLHQLERDLKKDHSLAQQFQAQFDDMIERGKMRLLTEEEEKEWTGKFQYLPMNYVLKASSTSTPLRIIFDPSSSYQGHAMNEYWGRGPNLITDIFSILLRFCENQVTLFADIQKMYQTVMTTPKEWHLHRVLWRNLEERHPEKYVIICNSFGDGPAGTVAIAAIHFLADMMSEYPAAGKTLRENTCR